MSIVVTLNDQDCADSFLIAPDQNRTFPVPLGLRTDDGSTVDVTLKVVPNGASIVIATTALAIGPKETFVEVHAGSPSSSRGDTVLQVLVDDVVQSSCPLTAITHLKVWFKGRFQARFATAGDPYNERRGTPAGWTFALEGEPDFVPADSVADSISKPVGREIRFHNPVALRSHVPPIGVDVVSVTGRLATGAEEEFVFGDPVLGLPVNLGPNSYFAGNKPAKSGDALPAEQHPDAFEPIALFEFHLGSQFSGKPLRPDDRPITDSDLTLEILTPEQLTRFGIPRLQNFNQARRNLLQADLNALPPGAQTGTVEGRNLTTRMNRMGATLPVAWVGREWFRGLINDAIRIDPMNSAVLSFLGGFDSFVFSAAFFNFHTDELCGQVLGYISAAADELVDPFEPKRIAPSAAAPALAPRASRTVNRLGPSAQLPPDIEEWL